MRCARGDYGSGTTGSACCLVWFVPASGIIWSQTRPAWRFVCAIARPGRRLPRRRAWRAAVALDALACRVGCADHLHDARGCAMVIGVKPRSDTQLLHGHCRRALGQEYF